MLQQNSGGFEQLDDVLDGVVGFVEGRFEFAVWLWGCSGSMVTEAVGERAAELLAKKDKQEGDFGVFLCQPISVSLPVAGEQPIDASAPGCLAIEELPTQRSARTMAYDAAADRIYLVAAEFGPRPEPTPENPRQRPPMIPGSFSVLVVGR
jgi:hypothetical protein